MIDWKASHKVLKREPTGKRRWFCKHLSGNCGVVKMLKIRNWQPHDNCPICNVPDEDTTYLLKCKDLCVELHWLEATEALYVWITNELTNYQLLDAILAQISK